MKKKSRKAIAELENDVCDDAVERNPFELGKIDTATEILGVNTREI